MDICTDSGSTPDISTKYGAFVYRLGHKIFILGRGVRLPYALQIKLLNKQIWMLWSNCPLSQINMHIRDRFYASL